MYILYYEHVEQMSYKKQELFTLREHLGSSRVYDLWVSHIFRFLYWVFLCFVCLDQASCFPYVTTVSGLAILDCSFYCLTFINLPDTIPIVRTRCIILVATNDTLRPIHAKKPPNIPHFIEPYLVTIIPDTKP